MHPIYYIKASWRNLRANKFFSLLNIIGLAIGLATGIVLLLWVQYEYSFDKFNSRYKNIVQVNAVMPTQDGSVAWGEVPGGIPALTIGMPNVEKTVRLKSWNDQNISNLEKTRIFDGNSIAYVDKNFLDVFDYKLIEGHRANFLKYDNSVAITQGLARKLFNTENAVGKKIRYYGEVFDVTSILADFPSNSTLQYSALFPMSAYANRLSATEGIKNLNYINEELSSFGYRVFFLLRDMSTSPNIAQKITHSYRQKEDISVQFQLQSLSELHLISPEGNASDLRIVQVMFFVAILILVVACINYINLTTARSLIRLKEVSVRKIIGAGKRQLFIQFMSEATMLFILSLGFSFVLIICLMPALREISGAPIHFNLLDGSTLLIVGVVSIGTLLLATLYPALLLSSFKPLKTLGGIAGGFKIATLRKGLLVVQFSVSFILLVSAIIINRQMDYIQNKEIGYDKSHAFSTPMTNNMIDHTAAIETELKKETSIVDAGVCNVYDFSDLNSQTGNIDWKGKPVNDNTLFAAFSADKNFINTMKFEFLEGGNFLGTPGDSSEFILNEKAVHVMGLKPPFVGQKITYNNMKGEVIGVVKDFNYQPLTQSVGPLILDSRGFKNILYVRANATKSQEALAATRRIYRKYAGNVPFSYIFLDKNFEDKYQSQQRSRIFFNAFSVIALFISGLGLFGLATYFAEFKTKEIGIRKVLGASVGSIIQLLSKDFLRLVLLAIVLSVPVGYGFLTKWLQSFAFRISIGVFVFVGAAVLIMLFAFITIGAKAFSAARANPIKSLKEE